MIDMEKKKNTVLLITALIFIGMFLGNYGQYQLAAVPSMVYEKFGLTDTQFSSIMTAPMIPAIFLSIIMGLLVDRFGIKPMVLLGYAATAVGFILRLSTDGYNVMFIAMVLTGVGCTVLNGNLSKIAASLYPMEKLGKVIGILMAGSTSSMAVAYATTALFPDLESAFMITAVAGTAVTVAWMLFTHKEDFNTEQAGESVPVKEALANSLKSKNVWLMGLSLMLLLGGATVISNFQVAYLTTIKGYTESMAGTFGTVLMIGSIIGSVMIPTWSARSKNPGVFLGIIGLAAAAATALMVMLPAAGIYAASFLNGCLRSGIISVMMSLPVMFPEIGPKYAGTAGGVAVTLELIGAVVIPTYIVIPLTGGDMTAYFYAAALLIAASSVLAYILTHNIRSRS